MRKLLAAVSMLAFAPAAFAQHDHSAPSSPAPEPATAEAAPAAPPATVTRMPGSTLTDEPSFAGSGFRVGVTLDHSVGQGTFENAEYFASVGGALVISPSYGFKLRGVSLGASANMSASYEYTPPDNPTGRHWGYSDIGLGLSAPAVFTDKFTGISLTPSIGASLPISIESRWRGVISSLSARLSASRAFGKFHVGGSFGASKTLLAELTRTISDGERSRRDDAQNLIFVCRNDTFNCGLAGVPTAWAMSGGVSGSYSPIDKLGISVGLNLSKGLKYGMPIDEYSSKAIDSNGNLVVTGQGMSDMMVGSIGVSYQLTDAIGASLSMGTAQPPKSADNQRFRFPFYAFEGQELSHTSYSFALSGTY